MTLDVLLGEPGGFERACSGAPTGESVPPGAAVLAPVESQEVWAAGVTYLRSRDARIEEALDASPYDRVYAAERPELFFKASAWRGPAPGGGDARGRGPPWETPGPGAPPRPPPATGILAPPVRDTRA